MSQVAWTDRFAAPLDGVRRAALTRVFRNRPVRFALSSRDRRIAWIVCIHACLAFTLTMLFSAPLLVLLPLLLGVPHVVADLRYLVLRRIAEPRARAWIIAGCAALMGVNVFGLLSPRFDVARAEITLGTVVVGAAGLVAFASNPRAWASRDTARGILVIGTVAILGWTARLHPRDALVLLIHLHNAIALVAWLWLFRARVRSVLLPLAVVSTAAALLAGGAFVPAALRIGVWQGFGTNLLVAADVLAPGVPGTLGVGLALSFIFMQSVHYLVWLVLIPSDERLSGGSVSFRRSFRDLVADLGALGAALAVGAWALVLCFGAVAPFRTRNTYLAIASFHVWLELAVLVVFAVGGRIRTPRAGVTG
jgi:hypothetical protein